MSSSLSGQHCRHYKVLIDYEDVLEDQYRRIYRILPAFQGIHERRQGARKDTITPKLVAEGYVDNCNGDIADQRM
eukprot:15324539-Ditylum_brightwellii.AAC.3